LVDGCYVCARNGGKAAGVTMIPTLFHLFPPKMNAACTRTAALQEVFRGVAGERGEFFIPLYINVYKSCHSA
jgi:hypothetical protein